MSYVDLVKKWMREDPAGLESLSPDFLDAARQEAEKARRQRRAARMVQKHMGGPDGTDDHPSGTPQSVHGRGGPSPSAQLAASRKELDDTLQEYQRVQGEIVQIQLDPRFFAAERILLLEMDMRDVIDNMEQAEYGDPALQERVMDGWQKQVTAIQEELEELREKAGDFDMSGLIARREERIRLQDEIYRLEAEIEDLERQVLAEEMERRLGKVPKDRIGVPKRFETTSNEASADERLAIDPTEQPELPLDFGEPPTNEELELVDRALFPDTIGYSPEWERRTFAGKNVVAALMAQNYETEIKAEFEEVLARSDAVQRAFLDDVWEKVMGGDSEDGYTPDGEETWRQFFGREQIEGQTILSETADGLSSATPSGEPHIPSFPEMRDNYSNRRYMATGGMLRQFQQLGISEGQVAAAFGRDVRHVDIRSVLRLQYEELQSTKSVGVMVDEGNGFNTFYDPISHVNQYLFDQPSGPKLDLPSFVQETRSAWAGSSSSTSSIAVQLAAAEELGLDPDMDHMLTHRRQKAEALYGAFPTLYKGYVRSVYELTQEGFRENGVTHLPIVRGMGLREGDDFEMGEATIEQLRAQSPFDVGVLNSLIENAGAPGAFVTGGGDRHTEVVGVSPQVQLGWEPISPGAKENWIAWTEGEDYLQVIRQSDGNYEWIYGRAEDADYDGLTYASGFAPNPYAATDAAEAAYKEARGQTEAVELRHHGKTILTLQPDPVEWTRWTVKTPDSTIGEFEIFTTEDLIDVLEQNVSQDILYGTDRRLREYTGPVEIDMQALSSFSTDVNTAMTFRPTYVDSRKQTHSALIRATVPVEWVWATSYDGFGSLGEHEVIVLGGRDVPFEAEIRAMRT